jgi:methyltransferase family protein
VDQYPIADGVPVAEFIQHDMNRPWDIDISSFDHILLLDVIEHFHSPEEFVSTLRACTDRASGQTVIVSTGNIAFIITRLMLLFGYFNYGTRGILDLTHTRLFTFDSMTQLFEQAGFRIEEVRGVPAPFPLALGNGLPAKLLLFLNRIAIGISKSLFSYQIFMVVRPLPTVRTLLRHAFDASDRRVLNQRVVKETV